MKKNIKEALPLNAFFLINFITKEKGKSTLDLFKKIALVWCPASSQVILSAGCLEESTCNSGREKERETQKPGFVLFIFYLVESNNLVTIDLMPKMNSVKSF